MYYNIEIREIEGNESILEMGENRWMVNDGLSRAGLKDLRVNYQHGMARGGCYLKGTVKAMLRNRSNVMDIPLFVSDGK